MATTASFVISFGGSDQAHLVAELDDVRNGNKTSFNKGEIVYFRVYHDTEYTIETTSGTASKIAENETKAIESEILQFVKTKTASVSKKIASYSTLPVAGVPIVDSFNWFGVDNNLGNITPSGATSVSAANADDTTLGIASVDYTTEYDVWQLNGPTGMDDIWHILVYIEAI